MILNSIDDREKWMKLISLLPVNYQDIYYHPDYISLNCLNKNSQGFLFFNIENSNLWINPFIITKVPKILKNSSDVFFDIQTAYGYGGPISNTKDVQRLENYYKKVKNFIEVNVLTYPDIEAKLIRKRQWLQQSKLSEEKTSDTVFSLKRWVHFSPPLYKL